MLGEAAAKVLRDTNAIEVKRNSVIHAREVLLNIFIRFPSRDQNGSSTGG
jgi:hypothetical protein